MVGPCGGHARKDGRTGFSSAAPAALQPLRWPHGVLKRCTCRASTFKMAAQGSPALRLPRFNLLDGRTGFSSAFFSVQRLHGFRQVVTHVQPQQKDELSVDSLKSAGNGPIHSPVSNPIKRLVGY